MKRLVAIILALAVFPAALLAQNGVTAIPKHEFRVGWGGMGFEKAAFRNSQTNTDYHHIGHFFAGYRYNFNSWLSAGMDADYSTVNWKVKGQGGHNYSNITLLPSARFTYYRKGILTMYSGLGIGMNINTGTEIDYKGRKTITAWAFNPVLYGVSINWRNFFASVDLSPLISMNSKQEIFMLCSRFISISIGYRL